MPNDQTKLFGGSGEGYWPQVYVACPLTAIAGDLDYRHQLSGWCHTICEGIQQETGGPDSGDARRDWTVRTNVPFDNSSPWKDPEADGDAIFRRNARALNSQTDALIVIAARGGSIGVGQELEWACKQGIPTLVVHPHHEAVSRQVEGAAHRYDITIKPFEEAGTLGRIVREWLTQRRATIESAARMRSTYRARLLVAQAVMRHTWASLDLDARIELSAVARMKPALMVQLLTDLDALAAAAMNEALRLTSALGLELGSLLSPAPGRHALGRRQLAALQQAAAEHEWDGATVLDLILDAERTLASPGVRRLRFESMQDWVTFHERRRN